MRFSGPSFIIAETFGYIFRLRVPDDLQGRIGLTEIRRSLRTRSRRQAKRLARIIAGRIQILFNDLRNGTMLLTPEQIKSLINGYIIESLEQSETNRAKSRALTVRQLYDHRKAIESKLDDAWRDLTHFSTTLAEPILKKIAAEKGLTLDADDCAHLLREISKAHVDIWRHELARTDGDYSPPDGLFYPAATTGDLIKVETVRELLPKASAAPSLKEVLRDYLDENLKANQWGVRTLKEYKNAYTMMLRYFGDPPVTSITAEHCRDYKATLMSLPPGFFKSKKYAGIDIHEVKGMRFEKTLSGSAVNRYLMCMIQLLDWAMRQGYLKTNPCKGLKLPRTKRPDLQRKAFDDADVTALFNTDQYRNATFKHPFQFWLPLLALFTGARLEEICQAHIEDYRQVDGVWVFDVNDAHPEKRLKPGANDRYVPLHPYLIDRLGFLRWLEKRRASGHSGRIFSELKYVQHTWGHYPSKWFTDYRRKKCGKTADGKSFHSFRHTFTDRLKQALVDAVMIDELTGHAVKGESMGRYGKRYSPAVLLEHGIMKLDFAKSLEGVKPFV